MHDAIALIGEYGLIVVFLNCFLDQAGLPLPAYPTLMVAAALGSRNGYQMMPAIVLAGVAGGMIADIGWYATSRRYGRRVLSLLCRISLSPDSCVRQTDILYARIGMSALLLAKFIPGLGIVSIALSGAARVSALKFILFDTIGALAYVSSAVILGALFRNAIFDALAVLAQLGTLGLLLMVTALGIYLLLRWWQRQAFIRHLRMDRISADELADMIDRGETPVILDVRPHDVRMQEGIIPGALFAHPADTDLLSMSHPPDIQIVVYCSCPNEASAAIAAKHLKRAGYKKIRPLLGGLQSWADSGRPIVFPLS